MEDKAKSCLHCPFELRKSLKSVNFTRHLKEHHNARYQELKSGGSKLCKRVEFNIDFNWALEPAKKR
jgi:hypothetical protein